LSTRCKTDKRYWDRMWDHPPRIRLPHGLFVEVRNIRRLLKRCIRPGMRVLEIGCAPGYMLTWVAQALQANVSGLDYSIRGIDHAKRLFAQLGVAGDLRCEDVFQSSFQEGTFDCVYSCGVIEHFDDPRQLVEIHIKLLKPGGKAMITIPNLAGIYGRIQHYFDPDILALHNLNIMNPPSMTGLAPAHLVQDVRSYPFGRPSAMFNIDRKLPRWLVRGSGLLINLVGNLQPFQITGLCPLIVLEMTRKREA